MIHKQGATHIVNLAVVRKLRGKSVGHGRAEF